MASLKSNKELTTTEDQTDNSIPILKTSYRSHSPISYASSSSEDDFTNDSKTPCKVQHKLLPVDPLVLNDLEEQAKTASRSIEKMMKYLSTRLQDNTKVTQETVQIYSESVKNVQKEVEHNIRLMYSLVAKCEELDRKMKPINELAAQVNDIKESLDLLEKLCQ